MPSRQDQLHSYQFMVQRVVGALVMRETDPAQSPFRRAAGATLASVLVALIAVGGAVVYGLFVGGGATKWKDPNVVIVEKESGAQYVYFEEKLRPVVNYTSALLIVGQGGQAKTVSVSRKSLEGAPRGAPLGIPNAPDSVAPRNRLITKEWTVCSGPQPGTGAQPAQSALLIGSAAPGGTTMGEEALLALHPSGSLYLVWHNRRHLIRDKQPVVNALGWSGQRQVPVAPALLNALPAGADLARVPIALAGQPSQVVPDARIGDVFYVEPPGGVKQYMVVKSDGLATITELQASLLVAGLGQQGDVGRMSPGTYANTTKSDDLLPPDEGAPPATIPKIVASESSVVCADVQDDNGVKQVRVGADLPDLANTTQTTARSPQGAGLADHVLVTPGRGVVVEAAAAPGATGGAISVITDLGQRHPVASADVLGTLGYGGVRPVRMPASLVSLVPTGAALDPEAARNTPGQQ
ncbi:type VII secretion protein EccB [Plantactinospora sonchi]|uniref:Type VII secretion protein EccB n=1 Tax=Plantactinospora sonchi TaxID=1544735 RepID=A0ABU7RXX5_9ACTN